MVPTDYKEIFIKNLHHYLNINNKKAIDITIDLNIPKSTVSSWMTKQRFPKMNTVEKLAAYFNIQKSDLLEIKNHVTCLPLKQYSFIPDLLTNNSLPIGAEVKSLPTIGIGDVLLGQYADDTNILIIKVPNEIINKTLPCNSFVAVKTNIEINDLKDCDLVLFGKSNNYNLMYFYNIGTAIKLHPFSSNSELTEQYYNKNDAINILGKVVAYIAGLK